MADDDVDLEGVAVLLRERKRELDARIGELAKAPERGTLLGFGKRIGDGTSEAITRITEAGVGTTLEATAAKIDRALAKIEEGTYGVCDFLRAADRSGTPEGGARERVVRAVRGRR